ncbi:MAG: isoprenylcysteine carboxylmethyltransferase family protein [Bacteroidetes bacterium]|nr:isoprenylcysteine carboxylmethyltransferase family protein [Bacteroidota bacterium]
MVIFIIIWSVWLISEILLNRLLRSGNTDKKDQDKGSMRIIWITIGVANSLGIVFSVFFHIPISNLVIIPFFGLFLIIVGMVFRFIAIWSLGRLFTVDVTIRANHKIKKDGVYRIIRHPSYSGSLLSFIGFGISLNNWISLIIIGILVTFAMLNRIKIEERLLIAQFGEDYLDYMKRIYRLIPWIY